MKIKRGWKALYINGKWIHGLFELQPLDFRLYLLPIIIGRARHLFGFTFHRWGNPKTVRRETMPKCAYLSISLFYLPSIDFRIGDTKTWFWVRNENVYAWKCHRHNKRVSF